METNLFLAPGEGDTEPEEIQAPSQQGPNGPRDSMLPEAIRMIREQNLSGPSSVLYFGDVLGVEKDTCACVLN